MTDFSTTIAAISTPPGKGGVAIIRLSGPNAFSIADKCFVPRGEGPLSARPFRTAVHGDIVHAGQPIDDGLATCFHSPHSYTGEDTVEFSCHGGLFVTRSVLEAVLACGAVLAQPGEFTRRAYLNGRLTLTDAEAIGNLLEASSMAQVRLAGRESRNHLSKALYAIHEEILLLLSSLYATIDYPEEDLAELTDAELIQRLKALADKIRALLATYRTGRSIAEGISTVICGKPNAGKSSLYNLLIGEDAAIVTAVAGTTRDLLERTVSLGDVTLRLCDTAGIRDTSDAVEQIGVARTRERIANSELVLLVFDSSEPLTSEDQELISLLSSSHATVIAILNKSDLPSADMTDVRNAFPHIVSMSTKDAFPNALRDKICSLFTDGTIQIGQDPILYGARQFSALSRTEELVTSTLTALTTGIPAEIAASDLELALGAISELDGRAVNDAVINSIFSHFCIGK